MSDLHLVFLPSWYSSVETPSAGIFIRRQALALSKAGVKVGLLYPDLDSSPDVEGNGKFLGSELSVHEGQINELRLKARTPHLLRPLVRYWAVRRLLAEYERHFGSPDLVHAHAAWWAGVIASFLPLPYVLTEHWTGYAEGLVRPWQVPLLKRAFERAEVRLAVSSALAEDLRPYVGGLDVVVLPNTVDTDFFYPPPVRPSYPPLRLVSIALLRKPKRPDLLILALSHLVKRGIDVVLELGGDGPQRGELERLAQDLGVGERVRFLGHLSPEEVRRAMHNAHIFALPSEYETFGVVYAEALSCGLPVIATERGGPKDFVVPEVGRLVPPEDHVALAKAIVELWENYERYEPNSLHEYAKSLFNERVIANKLIAIYERIRPLRRRA